MDTKRDTEPKPVYDVICETIADIMKRSNKYYETAVVQRETAAGTAFVRDLDFMTGDCVQVRSGEHAGKVGRITGVKYSDSRPGATKGMLLYNVQLSNLEAVQLPAGRLRFLSKGTTTDERV